mmetsp:Transcript_25522/g.33844  ORF Transcript_25522/g.33844 Transcript_25522/m.33844 type:complete len:342 (+) Transcript_25522:213-1238(+)
MSRLSETLSSIPLGTLSIILLCTITYAYQLLFDPPLHHYTMCPRNILFLSEYYRIITSTLFHGGFLHFFMNMSSTAAISSSLEHRYGTLRLIFTILWGMILTSFIDIAAPWLMYMIFNNEEMMYQHAVGFSGVIFQLSTIEANINPDATRSVFGFVRVPSYLYPWALLIVLQVLIPNISFMGHLSGILVGTMQLYGLLDLVILPSDDYLRKMEEWPSIVKIMNLPSSSQYRVQFVKTPFTSEGDGSRRNPSMLWSAIKRAFAMVWKFVRDVMETIKVCIFGRGRDANSNIQLGGDVEALWGSGGRSISGAGEGGGVDSDDDWVGLPPMPESTGRDTDSRMV